MARQPDNRPAAATNQRHTKRAACQRQQHRRLQTDDELHQETVHTRIPSIGAMRESREGDWREAT